jgi:DNA invertase Pin-like site-specific DNA recombinase
MATASRSKMGGFSGRAWIRRLPHLFSGPINRIGCVYLNCCRSAPYWSSESTLPMKIVACYIRVSTVEKTQAKQRREINRWLKSNRVNPKTVRWYIDKSTDDVLHRPKYDKLQADILDGKVRAVVVWHLDRLSGTTRHRLNVLIDWCHKSLRVVSVGQQIDVRSRDCGMISSVLRGVTEVDEQMRRERTKAGLASARARGRVGGRPKLAADDAKVLMAKELQKDNALSIDDICKRLKISRSTFYRYIAL